MELAFVIYAIELMQKLANIDYGFGDMIWWLFFTGLALFAIMMFGFLLEVFNEDNIQEHAKKLLAKCKKPLKYFFYGSFAVIALSFMAPTKETSYTMLAAYGVQTVAENEDVQRVAGKSFEVLESYMDEYLQEVNTTKNTEVETKGEEK